MTRVVLVEHSATQFKLYRQPQWMAEVRRNPERALLSKRYFDLEEDSYRNALENWSPAEADRSLVAALGLLASHGAIEILRA